MDGWLKGEESGTKADGKPDKRVRWALVLTRGQKCEECGWDKKNPVTGIVPLHVDHIEGDRTKNRPEDLRLLCPNCHSLTPTYQHLNNPDVSPTRRKQDRRYRETWLDST
jgi:predicted HNH restriction endonuclease